MSFESRRGVWRAFTKGQDFTEDQVEKLAGIDLNGRQIKNILKTAQLLATSKDAALSYGHVKTITELRASNATVVGEVGGFSSAAAASGSVKVARELM